MSDSKSTATNRALHEEQVFVDSAYAALDRDHDYYSAQLAGVRAQGASGTPGARSERDSFAAHYEDNLLRLRNVENRLVLGRLDVEDDRVLHVGRITLRSDDNSILLTDWRAPQSALFYQSTALHPSGVRRRRHIQTRLRKVVGVEDELLSGASETEAQISELNLTGEGALIGAISQARDGKMSDIVATIQAEQDAVIRSESRGVLVVQGGPGTGKTAVALHRAAYLLYSERERLAHSGVLIIGPSKQFLHYIDQVLPSLGESDVVSLTIDELLPGVSVTATEPEAVAEIKGQLVWKKIAQRAVKLLEKPLERALRFRINGVTLRLTPADVAEAQRRAHQSGKRHNQARETYARTLVQNLATQLAEASDISRSDDKWLAADVASDPKVRTAINKHWLPASPQWLYAHILKWPELLEKVAPELTPEQRAVLWRDKDAGITSADIPILDELAERLGDLISDDERRKREAAAQEENELHSYVASTMSAMGLGGGIVNAQTLSSYIDHNADSSPLAARAARDRSWTYGHVVVDEAQELSPMQWAMIARRNPQRSMTIVGDLDQRASGAPNGGWAAALGSLFEFGREVELTISYRTPSSILERAGRVMAALGSPVRPVHGAHDVPGSYSSSVVTPQEVEKALRAALRSQIAFLDAEYGEGLGTMAIIVPDDQLQHVQELLRDEVQREEQGAKDRAPRITIANTYAVKGLEYDAVTLFEPQAIAEEGFGNLYVAMTRATKRLHVLATHELPPEL